MPESFAAAYTRLWKAELRRRRPATLRDLADVLGRVELDRRVADAAAIAASERVMDLGCELDAACDLVAADVDEGQAT